jgi:mannose-6-phosphate isomerase-like protein (cupin superfamily)
MLMDTKVINIDDKFAKFTDQWSPKVIAQMNDYHFKLARIKGEFTWHSHPETDEVFLVIAGEMTIQFRDQEVHLKEGEMYVVPKGIEHKPTAESECQIMLIEPAGIVNTGDAGGEMTKPDDVWI